MGGALDPAVALGRRAVRDTLGDLEPGARIVVGVSGGADSLALAAVTAFVADRAAWDLAAVVVDHGLQQGSTDVAARAVEQVAGLGIPASVVRVSVGREGGIEAAARHVRREALAASDAEAVLLAHTLDDQAETVLLGLGRGSGPRSIAGMSAVDGRWRRPFLTLRRSQTEQICRASGLDWWDDPHNRDPVFRRTRVRHELMPLLEDVLGGGVAEALARTAELVRADSAWLDSQVAPPQQPVDVGALLAMPAPLRTRALRLAALAAGASELSARHVLALDALVVDWRGQKRVELPGGVSASREGASLTFAATPVAG